MTGAMRLAGAAVLCALLAASARASTDGDSPDFAHKFGLDTVKYLAERRSQAPSNLSDYYSGLKYFSRISPEPFWAVLPGMDMDASAGYSGQLWKTNKVDQVEDDLARQIFARLCQDGSPLVVDVGANIGWYTLLALAHGCRVVAIDAGADHLVALKMSLALNGWLDRARLYHAVATGDREVTFDGWSAKASSDKLAPRLYGQHSAVTKAGHKSFSSQTPVALDDIIDEEVAYLKVDVESHEPSVFRSARRLLERQLIKYVLFEWTYFIGGKYHFAGYADDVLAPLFAARYRCFVATANARIRMELTLESVPAATKRLHAHCSSSESAAGHHWCMSNIICMRHDQPAPMEAPVAFWEE